MRRLTPWLFTLIAWPAFGATVFEGFYRIERDRKHVGFAVQRLRKEGDRRILTTYYRFKRPDQSEVFESFKDVTKADGSPISSEHHGNNAGLPAIFARFTGKVARIDYGSANTRKPASVSGVEMLGSMLYFVADLPKLQPQRVFRYRAFAEKYGSNDNGTLHTANVLHEKQARIFQLVDDFGGEPLESFVSPSGQPLGSRAIGSNSVTFWVPSRAQAIDVFRYPNRDVISLFGDLPTGENNEWSKIEGLDAEKLIRNAARPKWTRVTALEALRSTPRLPVRAL